MAEKTYSDKEFRKIIQKHIDRVDFVKVNLEKDSSILGFIIKASDDFLMMEELMTFL